MSKHIKQLLDTLKTLNVYITLSSEDKLQLHLDENDELPSAMLLQIKGQKNEIIKYLRESKIQVSNHIPFIPEAESYPVSFVQKRLWLLSQIEENSVAYNIPFQVDLDEEYDIEIFKKAVYGIIQKHEILRTVFKLDAKGDLKQWIIPYEAFNFSIEQHDFRNTIQQESRVQELITDKLYKKFDLENGPLVRATIIQTEEKKYTFSCIMHHIVSDGWSRNIITNEIQELYTHYKESSALPVFSKTIQYKEYASWQLQQIVSGDLDFQKKYWLEKFSGEIPLLTFTSTNIRPHIASNNGALLSTYIASKTTKKLKNFCKKLGGSLFMGLMAVWRVLIYRYTSQKDVIIGTPIAGRNHIDVENQLGCFINTLALRQTINPLEDFYTLFEDAKNEMLEAFSHQDFPFDKLVEDLRIPREISRNPLFDVMLTMQNIEEISIDEQQTVIDFEIKDEGKITAKLDVDINFQEVGDYLSFSIIYNTDVYHKELITNLMEHFKTLLAQVLEEPSQAIGTLNFLSKTETDELITQKNDTKPNYTLGKNIIETFQGFVKQTPEKIALRTAAKNYTYKELDTVSSSLANFILSEKEVSKGDFVGVLLPRDQWLLISMLTIFKLGIVYVPIDVDYPKDRITHILNNTECSFVIDSNFIKKFEQNQHTISAQFSNRLSSEDEVAYVIHTSGSTGKPKAAMITHEGMMNHLRVMEQELELNTESIIVQNAATTFDISIWQLINALIVGGTTSIYDTKTIFEPASFLKRIATEKASVLQVVPSYLTILLTLETTEQTKNLGSLKYLLVTGEVVQKNLIEAWFNHYPTIPVVNAYGPAEAADDATLHIISETPKTSQVPIGHAVSNMSIYIVDENEQLCPKDVIGEIWVAGIGVGTGYYNNQQKTQENFRNNPFDETRPKLYKTGDLGYWSTQGELQFVGRKDNQVKVRGYRIELGEIEYALAKNERLKEVVVITKKDHENKNILVAYYTATEEISNEEIKNQLKLSIPSYMIPGIITKLDKLPVTPNGKVDRKALALIAHDENINQKVFETPKNETEEQLVEIWKEVLKMEAISINDNFFEIGGDSLSIIKVAFKIKEKLLMDISIISLFEFSDIVSLGAYIAYLNKETSDEENYEVLNI